MQNNNYELIRQCRCGAVKILCTMDNLDKIIQLKKEYKSNSLYTYSVRPQLVKIIEPSLFKQNSCEAALIENP